MLDGSPGRLTARIKLGYSSAELGLLAVDVSIQIYLLKFYNVVVGLPSLYTALALAIAIVWDAISDPIMGSISDRTRGEAGRRRPYFVPGAMALAIAFALLYNPPPLESTLFKFLFLLVSYILVNTAMTVIAVPHAALGGELSFDRDERTEIFGYRRFFDAAGSLLGVLLPAVVLVTLRPEPDADPTARVRGLTSMLLSVPILLTAWLASRATRGLDRTDTAGARAAQAQSFGLRSVLGSQREALTNRVFAPLLSAYVVAGVGRTLTASFALYYYDYRLLIPEHETELILMTFFGAFILSIPMWVELSRLYGKKWPAIVGVMVLGLMIAWLYPALPPGQKEGPVLVAGIAGILSGSIVLLDSLVPDLVDLDELTTGQNREGLYFGVWKMSTKLSRALGLILAGWLLDVIGFDRLAEVQAPEVSWRLAMVFGPVVGALFVVGGVCLVCMPLTVARHRRVQRLLERRHARSDALTPRRDRG